MRRKSGKRRRDLLDIAGKTGKWFRGKPRKAGTSLKGTRTIVRAAKAIRRATRRKPIYA